MTTNGKRVFALESWTVEHKRRGWFISRTYGSGRKLGPYKTDTSACLMIARQLRKELARRAAHH